MRNRRTVRALAAEASIDVDDALITLREGGFPRLAGPDDSLGRREISRARRALGLATRREIYSREYWTGLLKVTEVEFIRILVDRGIDAPRSGVLSKRAVHRLRSEAKSR